MCAPVYGKCLWVASSPGPYTPVYIYQPYHGDNLLCSSPPHFTTANSAPSHPHSTIPSPPNSHPNADGISSSMIWFNLCLQPQPCSSPTPGCSPAPRPVPTLKSPCLWAVLHLGTRLLPPPLCFPTHRPSNPRGSCSQGLLLLRAPQPQTSIPLCLT